MNNKALFLSLAVAAYSLVNTSTALALNEDDAILVKIQDIKPVKDNNGLTTACEFISTVYNHTGMDLSELSFNLVWTDEAVKNTIELEQNLSRNNANNNFTGTADYVSSNVVSTINIPLLKKSSQKSIRSKIISDRCFILSEDAQIIVSACKQNGKENNKGNFSCQSLFHYISSKSPEYYTDFLEVSIEDQKELDSQEKERQTQALDKLFSTVESNLNDTIKLLQNTNPPTNPLPASLSSVSNSVSTVQSVSSDDAAKTKDNSEGKQDLSAKQ